MVHGAPDNYQVQQKTKTYRLDDMGELAVRLGSFNKFDRLGEVIAFEDFENGAVHVYPNTSQLDDNHKLTGVYARSGGFAGSLTPEIPGANSASFTLYGQGINVGKIGFEVSFTVESDLSHIIIDGRGYTENDGIRSAIKYDHTLNKIYYLNSIGGYTELLADRYLYEHRINFHTIKFVLDVETLNYVRFRIDDNSYSLKDIGAHRLGIGGTPYTRLTIYVYNLEDRTCDISVDDLIITQNEP